MSKGLIAGVASQLLMTVISMVGNIILSGLVVRWLSPFDAGIWFTYLGVIVLFSFCDFGFSAALSREIALSSYKTNLKYRIENLYSCTTRVLSVLLILAIIVAIIFYLIVLRKYAKTGDGVLLSYVIFCIGFLFRLSANAPLSVVAGLKKVALQTNMIALSMLVAFILSFLSLLFQFGMSGLAVSYALSYAFLYFTAKFYVAYVLKLHSNRKFLVLVFKRLFGVSASWSMMNIGAIAVLQIPSFIIVSMLGPVFLTPFVLVRQLCSSILSLSNIIGNTAMPFLSYEVGKKNVEQEAVFFRHVVKYSTGIAVFLAIFMYFSHQQIADIWLGDGRSFNLEILIVMFIAIVFEAHHVSITKVCIASGYVKFARIALLAGIAVTAFSFLFITLFGLVGAAYAVLLGQILTNNWFALYVALRYLNIGWTDYKNVLSSLVVIAVSQLLIQLLIISIYQGRPLAFIFVDVLVSGVLFLATFMCFKSDRDLVKPIVEKLLN